jgi:hypothetical protein
MAPHGRHPTGDLEGSARDRAFIGRLASQQGHLTEQLPRRSRIAVATGRMALSGGHMSAVRTAGHW